MIVIGADAHKRSHMLAAPLVREQIVNYDVSAAGLHEILDERDAELGFGPWTAEDAGS